MALNSRGDVNREANELLKRVHSVVSDMAVENADLVDTTFIMDYLVSIRFLSKKRLPRDKTEAFVEMSRSKFQEEST